MLKSHDFRSRLLGIFDSFWGRSLNEVCLRRLGKGKMLMNFSFWLLGMLISAWRSPEVVENLSVLALFHQSFS